MLWTCTRFRRQVEMCRKKNRKQNETKSIFMLFCCELSAGQQRSPSAKAGAGSAYGSALHSFWKSPVGRRRGRTHFIKVNIFHLVGIFFVATGRQIPQRAGSALWLVCGVIGWHVAREGLEGPRLCSSMLQLHQRAPLLAEVCRS